MPKLKRALLVLLSLAIAVLAPLGIRSCVRAEGDWVACRLRTAAGEIQVRVYPRKAPLTVANFLRYAEAGLYDGSTFFRVVTANNQPNDAVRIAVVQGGDVPEEKCFPPIVHETTKMTGLRHRDGTVSMARAEPGTAACSFFICVGDQPELDFGGRRNPDGQGFAAYGRVVGGMEVVRRIHGMDAEGQYLKDPVPILSCIRLTKPSQLPGSAGGRSRRTGGIGDVREAVRRAVGRMAFKHAAALLLALGLLGWMAWRGCLRRRSAGDGTSRAAAGGAGPWLRALALAVSLLVLALLALLLIGM